MPGKKIYAAAAAVICFLYTACGTASVSRVPFSVSGTASLGALNKNSVEGHIAAPGGYAYFAFPCNSSFPARSSLQIRIAGEPGKPYSLAAGYLFADDFQKKGVLKKELAERPLVRTGESEAGTQTSFLTGAVSISIALPPPSAGKPLGFIVYMHYEESSTVFAPLSVVSASIVPGRLGWDISGAEPWFGFEHTGGTIPCLFSSLLLDTASPLLSGGKLPYVITFILEEPSAQGIPLEQERIYFSAGGDTGYIRRTRGETRATFNNALFSSAVPPSIQIKDGGRRVLGITAGPVPQQSAAATVPVSADPGLILDWPQKRWRQKDYELFSWNRFPSLLIFDTADYQVQDKLFKRLAFFTEKKGFTGRLASDREMAGLHGFNAHDYRAESLAAFFELARTEAFALNEYEILLRDALLAQKVIMQDGQRIVPGFGAVISVSRESSDYLRYNFMAHEGFHGLFFIDEGFRAEVNRVYNAMPVQSREFIAAYFTAMDTLGYNTGDAYLMQNELMAYLLQQPVKNVKTYFASTYADRLARKNAAPALVAYVKRTGAEDFVSAAAELEAYVYNRWGYAAGRVSLLSYTGQ